jgi:hypothetical protein
LVEHKPGHKFRSLPLAVQSEGAMGVLTLQLFEPGHADPLGAADEIVDDGSDAALR